MHTTRDTLDNFTITLNGDPLPSALMRDILEIVVDVSLHMPSMFEIHIRDEMTRNTFQWIDSSLLRIGVKIEIASMPARLRLAPRPHSAQLIKGEITALECDLGHGRAATLVARGYDLSHRLWRGAKTATYRNMTDTDIVRKVGEAAGFEVKTAATDVVHEYVLQNNVADMEFLRQRARAVGFGLLIDENGKLIFGHEDRAKSLTHTLTWGADLHHFRTRISAVGQINDAFAQGWDVKAKVGITGHAQGKTAFAQGGTGLANDLADARDAFGEPATTTLVDAAVSSIKQAEIHAMSAADEARGDFLEADGICPGHPSVRAGCHLMIAGAGKKYSGEYLISSATHRYTAAEGYVTTFSVSGRSPNTLLHAIEGEANHGQAQMHGVVIGIVTNNRDPENWGRVKVKFPWLGDAPAIESNWCRVATPMTGGNECGMYFLPEVDDEVLVAFDHDDPNVPYIVGALWNGIDLPPKPNDQIVQDGKVTKRIIKSRSGHTIVLDDTDGEEHIRIIDKTGKNEIDLDSAKNALTISVQDDCTIRCANLTLDVGSSFKVNAKTAAIKTKSTIDLEAGGPVAIDGAQVAMNKTALVVLK